MLLINFPDTHLRIPSLSFPPQLLAGCSSITMCLQRLSFLVIFSSTSGAFNVLLFLTVRSGLLLFNDPDIDQPTAISPAISNDAAKDNHGEQPAGAHIVDDVPPLEDNDMALSPIDSRPDV